MIDLAHVCTDLGFHPHITGPEYNAMTPRLAAFYGAQTNDSGVFLDCDDEELATIGKSSASVRVAMAPTGVWFVGFSFQNATGGSSCAPSVWHRVGYATRKEAVEAVTAKALAWFGRQIDHQHEPESVRREAAEMVKALTRGPEAQQLSLF